MKKQLKGFIFGIIVATLLMNTVVGASFTKTIEVAYNYVNLTVNGKKVEADNILYEGTTYVPIRAVAKILDKEVGWDQATSTASINDKAESNIAKVTKVVDGDTIIVNYDGNEERVRLIGVDTPESVHPDAAKNLPEGKVASEYTKSILEGKEVELEFDVQERDNYGRLLAYVWIDGVMFNKTLLEEGFAQIATYPPNVKYVDDFTDIQKIARENNKGFWTYEEAINNHIGLESGLYKGSIKSDKYHSADYSHKGQISEYNLIWFDSIEDAQKQGYKPCGICF